MPEKAQCPCGRVIEAPSDYTLLYLKRELREIDILCPNDACYLRELGYVRFEFRDKEAKFKEATFYPPFVTWNAGRIGHENSEAILKSHLREIVTKLIDWERISKGATS